MVKINTICRTESEYSRETKNDIMKVQRDPNPSLHPMSKPREYQRAVVASKMQKIFSKPFVGNLAGHSDAIAVLCKSPMSMTNFLSGSYDGEVRLWDVGQRKTLFNINSHQHHVKGLAFSNSGQGFLTSGMDKIINYYTLSHLLDKNNNKKQSNSWVSKVNIGNVSHSSEEDEFSTSGECIQIWNYKRSSAVNRLEWGCDSVLNVKYHPSEPHLLASTGIDRSLVLYDLRAQQPLRKTILQNKSQCLCWNPYAPLELSLGNDDANVYTFDMRRLDTAKLIHKDHISAVVDIDYAPSGQEFATASYDKTIRIFRSTEGKSREVYHGKRMQKVFAVQYSQDAQYVLSGSDDMNIRIWKAVAWNPMGTITQRQQNAFDYREKLKEKFEHVSEIRKISKHRHMPKYILNSQKRKQIQRTSKIRKLQNQEVNNANIFVKPKPEKVARIVETIE